MNIPKVTGCARPTAGRLSTLLLALVLAGGTAFTGQNLVSAQEPAQAPDAPVTPQPPSAPAARPAVRAPQAPEAVEPPEAPEAPPSPFDDGDSSFYTSEWSRPIVRVGQDYVVRAGERVREVVVVFGSATIEGRVDRDVVVVLGSLRLGANAVVDGSVVVVAGSAIVQPGARVSRDMVVTAGSLDAPADFSPGQQSVVIGLPGVSGMERTVPWFTRGLLWGRLIVPNLPWMWVVVAVFVGVYLVLNLLFSRPVRLCRDVIANRPFSAFLVGLLTLVMIVPVFFILGASVIGIPVIPFLLCGLFVAFLIGKIGLTRWIGGTIVAEDEPDNQLVSLRSFAIGTAVILFAYMIPVLGILVWAMGSVFGLGAATLALSSGLRRESPRKPRAVAPVAPPPAPAVTVPSPVMVTDAAGAQPLHVSGGEFRSEFAPEPPFIPVAPATAASAGAPGVAVNAASMPKAPFLDRLAAFALDILLVSLAFNLFGWDGAHEFFTLLFGYHIVFWALKATTVGGIICNLRVVRTDGNPLTFADALIRGFSSIFSLVALGIGCFWILFDADNQAWHDRFAGTWVVKVPKGWPV